MRDRGAIYLGLLVFLVLATTPIWYHMIAGEATPAPELKLPVGESECIAETEFMRNNHMNLVMTWRDEVVRVNQRTFEAPDGREWEKSLTHTCLACHAEKAEFCDKCHDYLGVQPYCWDCHVDPKGEM
jgi:hypothetical protein